MKILVCGGRAFANHKQLHRALDGIHRKYHITQLILDEQTGAAELAYFWAVQRRIREIITVPVQIEALTLRSNRQRHHAEMLQNYKPDVVVTFSYPQPQPIIAIAQREGFRVWDVPRDWKGG